MLFMILNRIHIMSASLNLCQSLDRVLILNKLISIINANRISSQASLLVPKHYYAGITRKEVTFSLMKSYHWQNKPD